MRSFEKMRQDFYERNKEKIEKTRVGFEEKANLQPASCAFVFILIKFHFVFLSLVKASDERENHKFCYSKNRGKIYLKKLSPFKSSKPRRQLKKLFLSTSRRDFEEFWREIEVWFCQKSRKSCVVVLVMGSQTNGQVSRVDFLIKLVLLFENLVSSSLAQEFKLQLDFLDKLFY